MNVFATGGGVTGRSPAFVGGTGANPKIFPSLLGPGFNDGGGSLSPSSGTPAAVIVIPGSGVYEGQQMILRASGTLFVHGTSPTVNFVAQAGSSLTYSSNTTFATLASPQSLTTASQYPFAFDVYLQGDSVSGLVQVYGGHFACDGVSGSMTLTDLTGVNFISGAPALNLVFGVTFAVTDALNVAQLMQWSIES